MPTSVQMQAKSSIDGRLYSWLSSGPDRSGDGYVAAGHPGSPLDIVVYSGPARTPGTVAITVDILSPSSGSHFVEGDVVSVSVATNRAGAVTIYIDGVARGTATMGGLSGTYSWTVLAGDIGSRTITARAVDAVNGTSGNSSSVPVLVASLGIPITGYTAIGVAQNSWRWDTQRFTLLGSAPNQYVAGDQMARLKVSVPNGCGYIDVEAVASGAAGSSLGCTVDAAIDGVAQSHSMQFTTPFVKQTIRLTVPGSGTRVVELFEQCCYVTGLTPQTSATVLPYSAHAKSCVYFGASGSEGYYAWDPLDFVAGVLVFLLSWVGRMKTSARFDASYLIASDGYGLQDYIAAPSPTTCAAWVAANVVPRCTGTSEITVVYEFGAGDYFHGTWTTAQITTFYGYLADATHAALPTARVFFKTLIVMSSPGEGSVNASGATQQDMRAAITGVATGRAWVTITKGYNAGLSDAETTSTGDLQDGKHATPVAQRDKIFPYMHSVL